MGNDFLIGYRITTQNSQFHTEKLSISKSMTPCKGIKIDTFTLPRQPNEVLEMTLQRNEEKFLTFAAQQSLHLQSHQTINEARQRSTETLTLPTQCYAVEFNDDFVTISLLK
jgi:hypothetical protein